MVRAGQGGRLHSCFRPLQHAFFPPSPLSFLFYPLSSSPLPPLVKRTHRYRSEALLSLQNAVPWTASTPLWHLGPLLCAHRLRASRQPFILFLFSLGDRSVSFSGLTVFIRSAACW